MSGVDHAFSVTADDETGVMDTRSLPGFLVDRCDELKARKELLVATAGPGADDLSPCVEVRHEGRDVATVQCHAPSVDPEQGLKAYVLLVGAFAPDEAWMATDAHMTRSPVNPDTGEEWQWGEMQHACDADNACELGLLTDCLLMNGIRRDGSEWSVTLPYHVNKATRAVEWSEPIVHVGLPADVEGRLHATMRQGWRLERPETNSEELPVAFLQAAVCRALHDSGFAVLANPRVTVGDAGIWATIVGDVATIVVEP